MIKLENYEVVGWEHAIRGMRNPLNSWAKSDTKKCSQIDCEDCIFGNTDCGYIENIIGENDLTLMLKLAKAGSSHSKYRRMIIVYADITAPLYWWKEFDTYKVGTVANSCSTMHKIHERELTLDDFSHEKLMLCCLEELQRTIEVINDAREEFLKSKNKLYWWQMIQLLPSSYNQKRTVMLNYEVLANMYKDRKNHKLDEWRDFCKWVESLPYAEIITGVEE